MPYTRVWTKNNPPGGQAANTADDEIRNLREDTEERMAALVTGWTTGAPTDPVVPLAEIKGNLVGKTIQVSHFQFFVVDSTDGVSNRGVRLIATRLYTEAANPATAWAGLELPVGVTITAIELQADALGLGSMTLTLVSEDFTTTPTATTRGVATVTGTGISIVSSSALAYVTLTAETYFLQLAMAAGQRLYGARITYTTPDCRRTL